MATFFDRLFQPRSHPARAAGDVYHPLPDPLELMKTPGASMQYRGWKVDWELIIQTMEVGFSPGEIIVLTHSTGCPADIWLLVQAEENPEIYDHGSGSRMRVKARVKAVQGREIFLEQGKIQF